MVKTTGGKKRRADATVRSKLNVNFLWNIVNQGHKCKHLLLKALDINKNNDVFPTLWIIILCLASMRVVEVGYEGFSAALDITFHLLYELD